MTESFGLIGSLFFAICSWPLAWNAWKTKTAKGLKWSFVLIWFFASFFSSIYAVALEKYVLLPNYISGGLGIMVVLYVKICETLNERKDVD